MVPTLVNNLNSLQDNPTFKKTPVSTKFYSSKLLNWVEPIEIAGKKKTVFYSELNTNINIGDRIFIVNGNYDSDNFISMNKYSKYTDGYRVLGRDGTRLVLDIEYTGVLPYNSENSDNYIRVQHIRSQREFDYINSIKIGLRSMTIRDDFGNNIVLTTASQVFSKFSGEIRALSSNVTNTTAILYTKSIIYATSAFTGSTNPLSINNGVTSAGYYIKVNNDWINITTQFLAGRLSIPNGNYNQNNSKIIIVGEDIYDTTISSDYFRQRNVYKFENSNWNIDVSAKQPFISKLNFRNGNFKGKHNDGIFGTNKTRNKWNGGEWNSGILINTDWLEGTMNSKSTVGEKTYYSTIPTTGSRPIETIDFSNNKGFGYNIIEDTNFFKTKLVNGNFKNCNIGLPSTFSATDLYFGDLSGSFETTISGKFELCNVDSVKSDNSNLFNCNVNNSNLSNSSLISSQFINTTAESCTISDKDSIKILAADLWSVKSSTTFLPRGILKLYISDSDLEKLDTGDAFYIKRPNKEFFLNSLNDELKILFPIETKYILDTYFDSDFNDTITVSIKTRSDNRVKLFAVNSSNNFSDAFYENENDYASIDIESTKFGSYDIFSFLTSQKVKNRNYILDLIDTTNVNQFFVNTQLSNTDFKSGYLNKSSWSDSCHVNYDHHKIRKSGQNLEVYYFSTDAIRVELERNEYNPNIRLRGEDLNENDIVWLNSLKEYTTSGEIKLIGGRYRVINISISNTKSVVLKSLDGYNFQPNSNFRVENAEFSNSLSINKFLMNNSTIVGGFFRGTGINNSNFTNKDFDNLDRNLTLENIRKLRLVNLIFANTNNTINSGFIYKSHFVNDIWNNGIAFNSIWNGGIFQNGVFNNSYWQNGIFNNGSFINSRELTLTTQDYNSQAVYKNWLNGVFNLGEFYNSIWINGTFSNGRFWSSEWYSGTWENGILGNNTVPYKETKMSVNAQISISGPKTIWLNGIVENALIGGLGIIDWHNGKFINGEMTADQINLTTWINGDFLGGKITGLTVWKNGNFYKGKFLSTLGWNEHLPTIALPPPFGKWGWENGIFYGGEFGSGSTQSNAVWFNGEFRGGIFMGRYWRNGIFTKGEFLGSLNSTIYSSSESESVDFAAVNSFSSNISPYFGFWKDGVVSDIPQPTSLSANLRIETKRKSQIRSEDNRAVFKNMLWLGGTFSHKNAILQSSIWLNGNFYNGTFDSGIFNAFADRQFTNNINNSSFATSSSVWHDGKFDSTIGTGSFYVSEWKKGTFEKGYMSGAIWRNGIWKYGTAENIYWENGIWRNGNWNGAPFGESDLNTTSTPFQVKPGRTKEIIKHIGLNLSSDSIYLINVFSASVGPEILQDTNVPTQNGSTSSFKWFLNEQYTPSQNLNLGGVGGQLNTGLSQLDCSTWSNGTTFSNGSVIITDPHVYTKGGQPERPTTSLPGYNWTNNLYNIPESSKLYARTTSNSIEVFTDPSTTYEIRVRIAVELKPEVLVRFGIGNSILDYNLESISQNSGINFNYYAQQYNITLVYNTPTVLTATDKEFYIKKIGGGSLRVLYASLRKKITEYHPTYNNTIWTGITASATRIELPNDSNIAALGTSDTASLVSINYGNGLFKSGIWENGVWNNGIRSNVLINQPDYYRFSNVVGFNGLRPFGGKNSYQVEGNNWTFTLKGLDSIAGLSVGDKISIGNIIAIDINENRRLIKDYQTIVNADYQTNTISINLVTNFPIRRIEKDSEPHLIYVSKNIWLTGAFLNGYFSGIWNNGLFKGSPYLTVMEKSHWVDGKFDGGHFISRQVTDTTISTTYKDSVIQNFTFIDNNVGAIGEQKYLSWIDTNFDNYTKTQLNLESTLYIKKSKANLTGYPHLQYLNYFYGDAEYSKIEYGDNLMGNITEDVLQSTSYIREKESTIRRQYNLGNKFNRLENYISDDGKFLDEFSNNLPNIDLTNMFDNGWTFSEFGNSVIPLGPTGNDVGNPPYPETEELFPGNKIYIDSNVDNNSGGKLRFRNSPLFKNATLWRWKGIWEELLHAKFSGLILENTNIENFRNRYYVSRIDVATYSEVKAQYHPQSDTGVSVATNLSATNSIFSVEIIDGVNELDNPNSIKTQYFYNKKSLGLKINSSSWAMYGSDADFPTLANTRPPIQENSFDITFNNISFFEVNMIPFFKYWEPSMIDNRVKTPYFATAPFIDYSNANFDFLENVNLTIDTNTIESQNASGTVQSSNVGGSAPGNSVGLVQAVTGRNSGNSFL